MKKLLIPSLLFIASLALSAQTESNEIVQKHFECFGNNVSIPLPADFLGPKQFPFEGGTITDFYTDADTCVVSILCGDNGELKLDASYKPVGTQYLGQNSTNYYSVKLKKYARKDLLNEFVIMYDHANAERKKELDTIFDSMQDR